VAKRKIDYSKRILARFPKHDWRNRRLEIYINDDMRRRASAVTSKIWAVDSILDQGSTPHCVGYAWAGY
jgi:hypothetical protein